MEKVNLAEKFSLFIVLLEPKTTLNTGDIVERAHRQGLAKDLSHIASR